MSGSGFLLYLPSWDPRMEDVVRVTGGQGKDGGQGSGKHAGGERGEMKEVGT